MGDGGRLAHQQRPVPRVGQEAEFDDHRRRGRGDRVPVRLAVEGVVAGHRVGQMGVEGLAGRRPVAPLDRPQQRVVARRDHAAVEAGQLEAVHSGVVVGVAVDRDEGIGLVGDRDRGGEDVDGDAARAQQGLHLPGDFAVDVHLPVAAGAAARLVPQRRQFLRQLLGPPVADLQAHPAPDRPRRQRRRGRHRRRRRGRCRPRPRRRAARRLAGRQPEAVVVPPPGQRPHPDRHAGEEQRHRDQRQRRRPRLPPVGYALAHFPHPSLHRMALRIIRTSVPPRVYSTYVEKGRG